MTRRVAVITGAARGLGYAIAERLSQNANCVLLDALPEVESAATALPGAIGIVADVADEASVASAVERIADRFGRVDILVNNAGIHPRTEIGGIQGIDELSVTDWDQILRVNLTGMFIVTKAVLPLMRKGGWGRIVNMSSRTGRAYTGTSSMAYATAKAGVIALTRQVAGSEGPNGITANCIAPGSIRTPMTDDGGEAALAARIARTVVGRIGEPDDIAAAVAFLASDEAGYISGATLDINGGSLML